MKFKITGYLLCFLLLAIGNTPTAQGNGNIFIAANTEEKEYVPDQLLVKIGGADSSEINCADFERLVLQKYPQEIREIAQEKALAIEVVHTFKGTDLISFREKLRQEPGVQYVTFNYYAHICSTKPNDPKFTKQYALENTGQVFNDENDHYGTAGADIKATTAWDWTSGSEDVVVAVIDTGVALNHQDLKDKLVDGMNFFDTESLPQDDNGHGTFMASIIAAATDNGKGIAGVCWKAMIMPLKALNSEGFGTSSTISSAINYAANNGAKIIYLGFALNYDDPLIEDACKAAYDNNCLLVAGSGNDGEEAVSYPAAYDQYCLAVGATDANDQLWSDSNYGDQIDLVAPGVEVYGADLDPENPGSMQYYGYRNGTSIAAAHVAGAAALLFSIKPDLTPEQAMYLICYTADDVNANNFPDQDKYMGYGRLNLNTLLSPFILQ